MGNPRAEAFTADMFAQYRSKRMAEGTTANNMNREQAYLRAVFNELDRLGKWKRDNPLKKLRAFKIQDNELTYLPLKQINLLLSALQTCRNKHVTMVAKVCLATGARWGEAEVEAASWGAPGKRPKARDEDQDATGPVSTGERQAEGH